MMNNTETKLEVREHLKTKRETRTRVYDSIPHEDPPTGPLCDDPDCKSARCQSGQREVNHQAWSAWRRRAIADVRRQLVPILAEHYGLDPNMIKLNYSQHAGCSMCPCSPGWIVRAPASLAFQANDVWVSPPRDPELAARQQAEAEARRIEADAVL
jgi:hypothetical protein